MQLAQTSPRFYTKAEGKVVIDIKQNKFKAF